MAGIAERIIAVGGHPDDIARYEGIASVAIPSQGDSGTMKFIPVRSIPHARGRDNVTFAVVRRPDPNATGTRVDADAHQVVWHRVGASRVHA